MLEDKISLSDCTEPREAEITEVTNVKRFRSEMNINQPCGLKKLLGPNLAARINHMLINSLEFLLFTTLYKCSYV